ncbi:monosaccharide ABC transporter substrate-binding protein (CUT2 family) [Antricoccus suffuscus]|uniref:Monosaccharide ABC transporter substrate-binding protein (CUT2 family) n=1 Tax=Antricoccus suffuscus TaxID=1629062 RepID=A0A2T1A5Y2_9ACTN|nr:substrate-binding domain-containing protein [Antricoccus suffuscus]PRZ44000.1 monosaccharide ABC transporter substrate-binding protein (CUT2 family) [Antricoccus suffuscus]
MAAAKADVAKYSKKVTDYPAITTVSGGVASLKGKSIWYVPLGGSLPIFQGFGVGVKQAAEAAGMTVHVCDGQLVPTTEASCLNQAATQGASAVIGGYIDYVDVPTAYDSLITHQIPALIAGEPPSGGKTSSAQIAFYDATKASTQASELAINSVIADSAGNAHILYMGITDTKSTAATANAAKSFTAKSCPGCTFDLVMYNTANLNKVASLASAALISHPNTNYVVVEVDSGEPAVIQGIQSAGFANKVKLTAISGTLPTLQKIASGQPPVQLSDVGSSPVYTGWQWVDAVIRMMKGQTPDFTPPVTRLFTKDNVAGLTLTPDAYASNAWYGPDTFQSTFKKAWGVG